MEQLDRRQALILGLGLGTAVLASPRTILAEQVPSEDDPPKSSLEIYQEIIQPEQVQVGAVIDQYAQTGVQLLPYLTATLFNRNFPFWRAGQVKYGVSWLILSITHGEETMFSTHPNPNGGSFRGAMQREKGWPDWETDEAGEGFEFLAELPQGYTTDWKEILWAARYIKIRTDPMISHYGSFEEASLQSLYQYCSEPNARKRISNYRRLKPILLTAPTTPDNPEASSPASDVSTSLQP